MRSMHGFRHSPVIRVGDEDAMVGRHSFGRLLPWVQLPCRFLEVGDLGGVSCDGREGFFDGANGRRHDGECDGKIREARRDPWPLKGFDMDRPGVTSTCHYDVPLPPLVRKVRIPRPTISLVVGESLASDAFTT